jgi:hypothetical protein
MFFTHLILASLTVTTALANHHFHALDPHVFGKRQEYQPPTHQCGIGKTCEESCGSGYLLCSDPTTFLCYNPDEAQTCCESGSASSWACPDGDYCLVDGWCCPRGLDPKACAISFGVTLPATFVGPTATPVVSNMTVSFTTPTSAIAPPTSASNSLPEFTGAASVNTVTGRNGLLYTVMIIVGNLF